MNPRDSGKLRKEFDKKKYSQPLTTITKTSRKILKEFEFKFSKKKSVFSRKISENPPWKSCRYLAWLGCACWPVWSRCKERENWLKAETCLPCNRERARKAGKWAALFAIFNAGYEMACLAQKLGLLINLSRAQTNKRLRIDFFPPFNLRNVTQLRNGLEDRVIQISYFPSQTKEIRWKRLLRNGNAHRPKKNWPK